MRHTSPLFLIILILVITGCTHSTTETTNYWDLSKNQRDSIDFVHNHHYTINYNFQVTADSLQLMVVPPNESELFAQALSPSVIHKNDKVVVAATSYIIDSTNQKTFYIKIARDQETMGWIEEEQLLANVVPCDPISQFIHTFSNNYFFGFCILIALSLLYFIYRLKRNQHIPFVHFQDIDSMYPALLCVVTAFTAILYGIIQHYMPQVWETFYYNPSLNPIGQSPILSLFLICTWILLILFIATLDEVFKQLRHTDRITYLLGLAGIWFIIYVFFSQAVKIYLSYPLFIAYLYFAWYQYRHHHIANYMCGKCGRPLRQLGKCPHCGAINK